MQASQSYQDGEGLCTHGGNFILYRLLSVIDFLYSMEHHDVDR